MMRIVGHTSLKSSGDYRRNKALRVGKGGKTTPFEVLTVAQTSIQHHVEEQPLAHCFQVSVALFLTEEHHKVLGRIHGSIKRGDVWIGKRRIAGQELNGK
jgi:hypothetical protein